MRNMTIPQVQKMVGTTFVYHFDGDSVPAVIAAFVPGKGFTCLATESVSKDGERLHKDNNGEVCLIGIHAAHHDLMKDASIRCRAIRDTGMYTASSDGGAASCALS